MVQMRSGGSAVAELAGPDNDLEAKIERVLSETGYTSLRQVQVSARDGRVVLRGTVNTYYLKQVAQQCVLAADGSLDIDNQLVVVTPSL